MSVKNALDSFAFDVIEGSKRALIKKNKNSSKKLSNSLDYDLNVTKNGFSLSFKMEDYGDFVDKGVKGVGGVKADGTRWKLKRVVGSKFSYKKPSSKGDKSNIPSPRHFSGWIVKRGFAPRNKKGQFITRKGLQFAIANSVYHTGIETSNFFTTPFKREFKQLPKELIKAYKLELPNFLEFARKK